MNKKTKFLAAAGILATALAQMQSASAHMEPKANDGMEKCYGVVKAHKNDCASKSNKHSCATLAKADADANEWVKTPQGLCDRISNGSTKPKNEE